MDLDAAQDGLMERRAPSTYRGSRRAPQGRSIADKGWKPTKTTQSTSNKSLVVLVLFGGT